MVVKIPALTLYLNEREKARIHELAQKQGVSNAKLASMIIREWVQARMPDEEDDEYYYEEN